MEKRPKDQYYMTSYDCTIKPFSFTFIQYYAVNIVSIHIHCAANASRNHHIFIASIIILTTIEEK